MYKKSACEIVLNEHIRLNLCNFILSNISLRKDTLTLLITKPVDNLATLTVLGRFY